MFHFLRSGGVVIILGWSFLAGALKFLVVFNSGT